MLTTFTRSALILLFVGAAFAANKNWRKCQFDPTTDLNDSEVLYLRPDANEFLHPETPDSFSFAGEKPVLRIVCPGGSIVIGNDVTDLKSASLECLSGQAMKINNTCNIGPLSEFGCTATADPVSRLTTRKTPNGKKIAEIGYAVGSSEFVPVIDDIQVSKHDRGYITRWLHYKLSAAFDVEQQTSEKSFVAGPLTENLDLGRVYDEDHQRKQFLATFKSQKSVDKYMPDGESFVTGQLVTPENFYYDAEINATYLYESTAPIWNSVNSGNWQLVDEIVRNLSNSKAADIDVWSGTYLNLWLRDEANKVTYVDLPTEIKPAQFLFKYVFNRANEAGVVFVTVNNPHLTKFNSANKLCAKLPSCELQYPEFADFSRGFTYCCTLNDFQDTAKKLGLPAIKNSRPMFE